VVARVDYDRRLHRAYRAGRALSGDTGRLWMDALAVHLVGGRSGLTILDLGAGTGRFSTMLADAFDASVIAVEPSEKMRAEAARGSAHPRVVYRDGVAAAIAAAEGEFDFAFLSMVIHHVPDVAACARELHRVVRRDGLVFIRNVFSGRLDGVRHYEFFPSARAIDETRLPTVERVRDAFVAQGFEPVTLDTLEQEIDVSLNAHYERLTLRALSTFELISDAEFEAGLARLRRAADLETTPSPVLEKLDLLTLRRTS
jgi:ubiquinone/menaquinone biosynthesis C-methylase UbiE